MRDLVLITGGAGFIGTNLAARLLENGERVLLFDNLSRSGVQQNLAWLRQTYRDRLTFHLGDVRDAAELRRVVRRASAVFHFAAQVAVTTSVEDPVADFEVNARGTFNVLEAVRETGAPFIFTSTNKVYGALDDMTLRASATRYEHPHPAGVSERQRLSFHSPYGCSKGAADQYTLDYARTYGLPALVFRMSCIYGPHQHGNEDQGWIAHFLIRALGGESITIYGDGKQVRDILFVEDLVNAFLLARENAAALAGEAFNIGGGPQNTVSLLELLSLIGELRERPPLVDFGEWRVGDQRHYVSDTRKFSAATGWMARVNAREGIARLHDWLVDAHAEPELIHAAR